MFRTRIVKEIMETRLDLRSGMDTGLFGVLLVLGVYVGRTDGGRRLANCHREHRRYGRPGGGQGGAEGPAEGFRHPGPLPIFAAGLDPRVRQLYNRYREELGADLKGCIIATEKRNREEGQRLMEPGGGRRRRQRPATGHSLHAEGYEP